MTPLECYLHDIEVQGYFRDSAQEQAIRSLDELYHQLIKQYGSASKRSALDKWVQRVVKRRSTPLKGYYFWGGVGRGKTYIMDTFYEAVPFKRKMRTHFHRFMKRIHEELKNRKGEKNPLKAIAKTIADEAILICFDEFFVSDIGDAMILSELLTALFDEGVCLVTTSNRIPDDLYKDGLQRIRFLPAIELLKQHTHVVNLDNGVDYRLRVLEQEEIYHYPLDDQADVALKKSFDRLCTDDAAIKENEPIVVLGRQLTAKFHCENIAWLSFDELCDGPRSTNDYIELAKQYQIIVVSQVPQLGSANDDKARRFINMIDEFYDRNVKVIMSAEVAVSELYTQGLLKFEFDRTISRLLEMQSKDYLSRELKHGD